MNLDMKELTLHTLRGDIQGSGMDGMNKRGIKEMLFSRYVNEERKITKEEFNSTLDAEYAKVEAWRERKWGKK